MADERNDWDPTSQEARDDPHGVHAELRQRCPVAYSSRWGGFWTLTKHADVVRASRETDTFTATRQTVIPTSPRKGLPRLPLQLDPPEHSIYRKALNPYFKESRIERLEPELRRIASTLLDQGLVTGTFELGRSFTEPFTVQALCVLVGLDLSESGQLADLSRRYVHAIQAEDLDTAASLSARIDEFAKRLVAERRRQSRDPANDIVTGLIASRAKGEPFSDEEVAGMIRLLLIGGHIVPRNFLGSAIVHLARDTTLQRQLRDDPNLLQPAVEELLRMYSPNQALVRTTTRPTRVRGELIGDDRPVALLFISANRDEDVFENPNEFDLTREPNKHIAFGSGAHVCIAQFFARMECRVALGEFLGRTQSFVLDGDPTWASWSEYGVREATLRVDVAAKSKETPHD